MTMILGNGTVLFEHYADLQAVLDANLQRLPDSYKPAHFICACCGKIKRLHSQGGTGYAIDGQTQFKCYQCCGADDAEILRAGKEPVGLYLVKRGDGRYIIANWPGTLSVSVDSMTESRSVVYGQNVAKRLHVKFTFEGIKWYGDAFGDAQLCRCYPVGYHCKGARK